MTLKEEFDRDKLIEIAQAHMKTLCAEIETRRVGSPGNWAATDYFSGIISDFGFQSNIQKFDCIDWEENGATIEASGSRIEVYPGPYTLGCNIEGELRPISRLGELEHFIGDDSILLIYGELANEQLMPKNFPFYNPENHQRIISLFDEKRPLAIAAATTIDRGLAGGLSPFPLIEDGDFDIPSVYMSAATGARLAEHAGEVISLEILANRSPAVGWNVVATKGVPSQGRIVVCAHIDSKDGSPGAIDNAGGVAILLLLAELLENYSGAPAIEILAVNGEDYYAASGEILYLERNKENFADIHLAINIDAAGYKEGLNAVSMYECPEPIESSVKTIVQRHASLTAGPQWYQSDHAIFVMNGRPAIAVTSEDTDAVWSLTHTERDNLEIVDPGKLVDVAWALRDLIYKLPEEISYED